MLNKYILAGMIALFPMASALSNPFSNLSSRETIALSVFIPTHAALWGYLMKEATKDKPNMSEKLAYGFLLTAGMGILGYSLDLLTNPRR